MDILWPLVLKALQNFLTLDKLGVAIRALLLVVGGTLIQRGWLQADDLNALAMTLASILLPLLWSVLNKEWLKAKVVVAASLPPLPVDEAQKTVSEATVTFLKK